MKTIESVLYDNIIDCLNKGRIVTFSADVMPNVMIITLEQKGYRINTWVDLTPFDADSGPRSIDFAFKEAGWKLDKELNIKR